MPDWRRVTKSHPCPVCKKPDWCGVSDDGEAVCCMRIESAIAIEKGGWLHRLNGTLLPQKVPPKAPKCSSRDAEILHAEYLAAITPTIRLKMAREIGVSARSLEALNVGWYADGEAAAFPMSDAGQKVVGIRYRRQDGRKWTAGGTRNGLFVPHVVFGDRLLICEGPTDTAALLTLGFRAIGRPSCSGGVDETVKFVQGHRVRFVVVVADQDKPGMDGADRLARTLWRLSAVADIRVITPPDRAIKDARGWLRAGAKMRDVIKVIEHSPRLGSLAMRRIAASGTHGATSGRPRRPAATKEART